jgi:flagellar hook-basal body complex protein FliE
MIVDRLIGIGQASSAIPDAGSLLTAPPSKAQAGAEFTAVLGEMAADVIGTLKGAEATAGAGVQGKASVQQVVEAVMSAERTLQATLAVRDKVVAAYLELSRMAI